MEPYQKNEGVLRTQVPNNPKSLDTQILKVVKPSTLRFRHKEIYKNTEEKEVHDVNASIIRYTSTGCRVTIRQIENKS